MLGEIGLRFRSAGILPASLAGSAGILPTSLAGSAGILPACLAGSAGILPVCLAGSAGILPASLAGSAGILPACLAGKDRQDAAATINGANEVRLLATAFSEQASLRLMDELLPYGRTRA